MLKTLAAVMVGAVIVTSAIATNALAISVPPIMTAQKSQSGLLQVTRTYSHHKATRHHRYHRYAHGHYHNYRYQCEFSRFGCGDYYRGYYNRGPQFLLPGLMFGIGGYGSDNYDDFGHRGRFYGYHSYRGYNGWNGNDHFMNDGYSNGWVSHGGRRRLYFSHH